MHIPGHDKQKPREVTLEEIRGVMGDCRLCPLYETRTKNLMLLKVAAVACVLMEIFAIANGFAGGQAALAIAFVSVSASVGVFIAAVLKYVYQPFNRLNNILWMLFVIWAVGALPLTVMASIGS